jgi:hypothetical protein
MDFKVLNEKVLEIIRLNEQLEDINYNDPRYDELEDKVYDLQDEINGQAGKLFDEVMANVYKQLNSKDDILNFSDYIAKTYMTSGSKNPDGSIRFDEVPEDSITISVRPEALQGKKVEGKIYIKPNPLRIGFAIGKHERIVWSSEN